MDDFESSKENTSHKREDVIQKAQQKRQALAALLDKVPNEARYTKEEQHPYYDINFAKISAHQLSDIFLQSVKELDSDVIDIPSIEEFLQKIKKLEAGFLKNDIGTITIEKIKIIMYQRLLELHHHPERAKIVLVMLVSSLKSKFNKVDHLLKEYGLEDVIFDEWEMKQKIIKSYKKEKENETPEDREIMANVDGRINAVVFSFIKERLEDQFYLTLQFLNAKNAEKDFVVRCIYQHEHEFIATEFYKYLQKHGIDHTDPRVQLIPIADIHYSKYGGIDYSAWIRDGAVMRNNGTIVEPARFHHDALGNAYEHLIPVKGVDIEQSELVFEGGNMRSTKKLLFIGYDELLHSVSSNPFAKKEALNSEGIENMRLKFEKEFGKKTIVIGNRNERGELRGQPLWHIDLFMTPISDDHVLIADVPDGTGKASSLHSDLNDIATELRKIGIKVDRIPMKIVFPNTGELAEIGLCFTYNNSLTETYVGLNGEQVKKVYLPQYYAGTQENPQYEYSLHGQNVNFHDLNKSAIEAYQNVGFQVIPINISVDSIRKGGSINCLTFEERERK